MTFSSLSAQQELVRCNFVSLGQIFELIARVLFNPTSASPNQYIYDRVVTNPMKGDTLSVLSGDGVGEDLLDPISHVIFVVIKNHHLKAGMIASQNRTQMIAQEYFFFNCSECAGLYK